MQEFRLSSMEERNYGIDLLRIVSMMMVVLLHVLGQGGSDPLTVKSETAWLLEIGAYSAVNIYAMISGYVGYGRKYKYSGLVYLYFQVLFYTVPTTIIFYIYRPELVNLKGKRELLFPFAYNTYWYFTAYFCLAFFIPFLNMMLERLDRGFYSFCVLYFPSCRLCSTKIFHGPAADIVFSGWQCCTWWEAILRNITLLFREREAENSWDIWSAYWSPGW